MTRRLLLALLVFACATNCFPAYSANEGTAVGVNPDAIARLSRQDRILQVGTDVSVGETIVTGPAGQVQLVFDDSTRLVVGPGSSLLIETYLLAGPNTAQKLTINALGGTFRFITGNSPKPAYSINTPTVAIAVRGTAFDLIVARASTRVMLYQGALEVCSTGGDCAELTRRCEIAIAARGQVSVLAPANQQRAVLSLDFRYARFERSLLADFRVNGATQCINAPTTGGSSDSLSPMGSGDEQETTQDSRSQNRSNTVTP